MFSTEKESMAQNFIHFENIKSTNAYLQDQLAQGNDITDWVVSADFQEEGKGMDTNKWESDQGQNLLFSMALDVSFLEAKDQFLLSQAVPIGILQVLGKELPKTSLYIKWPNDIYYSDKKLGGMLIINNLNGNDMGVSIIGIGLNVNQTKFRNALPNPISMKMITDSNFELKPLLYRLVDSIKEAVFRLKKPEGVKQIKEDYIRKLYRYGKKSRYEIAGKELTLLMLGTDVFGRLELQDEKGFIYSCDIKQIKFLE